MILHYKTSGMPALIGNQRTDRVSNTKKKEKHLPYAKLLIH